MENTHIDWEQRVAACWADYRAERLSDAVLVQTIDALAAERTADDPDALFERACARDSAGLEADAEPLYCAALASADLDPARRPRAVIQLASTLRLLKRFDESERLLRDELARSEREPDAPALPDETRAILALTLLATGRPMEAAELALITLAPRLSRYQRSVAANARDLCAGGDKPR